MNFAIVILSYNQPETTVDCIKSLQAVKPREFSDRQVFVVHNGSDEAVVADLRKRFPRFYHVVLSENEGFAAGANAGISSALALFPWVLFLTQDTSLVHFPMSPPFEPCMATVKIYKRSLEHINSLGGAVDLEIAKNYLCPKPELFWNSFESEILAPYVPRTAFWIHQTPFEKLGGFDESIGTMWEDVEFGIRLRREGEMLQLDETTEVIHHRKGICRKDPLYTKYYYNRNRFFVSRQVSRSTASQIKFELGLVIEWLLLMMGDLFGANLGLLFYSYLDSRKFPLPQRYGVGMAAPLGVDRPMPPQDSGIVTSESKLPPKKKSPKPKPKIGGVIQSAAPKAPVSEARTQKTATATEADTKIPTKTDHSAAGFKTTVAPPQSEPVAATASAHPESKFSEDDES